MNIDIPCKECICLPVCKSKITDIVKNGITFELYHNLDCALIKDFLCHIELKVCDMDTFMDYIENLYKIYE